MFEVLLISQEPLLSDQTISVGWSRRLTAPLRPCPGVPGGGTVMTATLALIRRYVAGPDAADRPRDSAYSSSSSAMKSTPQLPQVMGASARVVRATRILRGHAHSATARLVLFFLVVALTSA